MATVGDPTPRTAIPTPDTTRQLPSITEEILWTMRLFHRVRHYVAVTEDGLTLWNVTASSQEPEQQSAHNCMMLSNFCVSDMANRKKPRSDFIRSPAFRLRRLIALTQAQSSLPQGEIAPNALPHKAENQDNQSDSPQSGGDVQGSTRPARAQNIILKPLRSEAF